MQIHGPSHLHGAQSLSGPHRAQGPAPQQPSQPLHGADQLDISAEASFVGQVHEMPEMRFERVAEIRQQIEAGTYDTEEKLNIAVGRLLDELSG